MRTSVYSGRAWIPPEWRTALGLRFWKTSGYVMVTGAASRGDARDLLMTRLPLVEAEDGEPGGVWDEPSARRMMRRLTRGKATSGVSELLQRGVVQPHWRCVYVWRSAGEHEPVCRVEPDGWTLTPFAEFQLRQSYQAGQQQRVLVAVRGVYR